MSKILALLILGQVIVGGVLADKFSRRFSAKTFVVMGSIFFISFMALGFFLRVVPEWVEPKL